MRVYLAGPMFGRPDYNSEAFSSAQYTLEAAGHSVMNPHYIGFAFAVEASDPTTHASRGRMLLWDLEAVNRAEALVLLPGFLHSRGATAEIAFAAYLSLPIYAFSHETPTPEDPCAFSLHPVSYYYPLVLAPGPYHLGHQPTQPTSPLVPPASQLQSPN